MRSSGSSISRGDNERHPARESRLRHYLCDGTQTGMTGGPLVSGATGIEKTDAGVPVSTAIACSNWARGTLCLKRKVDHHDGVFLDHANQQDNADQGDHAQVRMAYA